MPMPGMWTVCRRPGCGEVFPVDGGRCPRGHGGARRQLSGARWRALVRFVVRRDRGICWLCGKPGATSADHVIRACDGGAEYDASNLRAAHVSCNLRRAR